MRKWRKVYLIIPFRAYNEEIIIRHYAFFLDVSISILSCLLSPSFFICCVVCCTIILLVKYFV